MDLVKFELTTSSMPWLWNQSLTDTFTGNTKLTGGDLDLTWTPRACFHVGSGLKRSTFRHSCFA